MQTERGAGHSYDGWRCEQWWQTIWTKGLEGHRVMLGELEKVSGGNENSIMNSSIRDDDDGYFESSWSAERACYFQQNTLFFKLKLMNIIFI